ncbi:two component transcriptional regulator, winged helix family [Candidatus Magnetoovum chiemensis]|nr:two component transcriptional regulator, winged helix family [Candidatus Magnetoovum chiemensis]
MTEILIIDDDRDILKVLKANLEMYNFVATTADTWKQARQLLNEKHFSLIILDIMLPDSDGISICRDLRKDGSTIPIIMLTAKDKLSDKIMGLDCGADDYVVKPFEILELVARIKACLRRSADTKTEILTFGDIVIDTKKRQVTVNSQKIAFTVKEYELLVFLAKNKAEVISREKIRKNIWKDSA